MARIESLSLTEQVTQELGKTIIGGRFYDQSDVISEAMLCTEFQVSRTAIRESVKILNSKGLITSHSRKGIVVEPLENWNLYDKHVLSWILLSQPSVELLYELAQLRSAIEPQSAVLAAEHITESELNSIASVLTKLKALTGSHESEYKDLKVQFHTTILNASQNRFFLQLKDVLKTSIHAYQAENIYNGSYLGLMQDYSRVYEALFQGDALRAQNAMVYLIDKEMLVLEALLNRRKQNKSLVS